MDSNIVIHWGHVVEGCMIFYCGTCSLCLYNAAFRRTVWQDDVCGHDRPLLFSSSRWYLASL